MSPFPASVQPLLDRTVQGYQSILGDNLVGIYLHGSLAMGEFNPHSSDVDYLIVVRTPLDMQTKQAVAALTLELALDAPPKGLEFSIVLLRDTQHFTYPTPFEFHASPYWYEALRSGSVDLMTPREDPDLAAHFVITRSRGVCLYGEPIDQVFGDVAEYAYWSSIYADAEAILEDIIGSQVYGVLNLCRVMAYQQEKLVTSKREGARWALDHLDARFHPLIAQALAAIQSDVPYTFVWDDADLTAFGEYIKPLLFG